MDIHSLPPYHGLSDSLRAWGEPNEKGKTPALRLRDYVVLSFLIALLLSVLVRLEAIRRLTMVPLIGPGAGSPDVSHAERSGESSRTVDFGAMKQPLCWITNDFDRSPAESIWVTSNKWGPLRGSLLSRPSGTL
jgi:hypothetical protein